MAKTAVYTRRAVDKYRDKYDFIQVKLDKGSKDYLKQTLGGVSVTAFCSQIVNDYIKAMQKSGGAPADPVEKN